MSAITMAQKIFATIFFLTLLPWKANVKWVKAIVWWHRKNIDAGWKYRYSHCFESSSQNSFDTQKQIVCDKRIRFVFLSPFIFRLHSFQNSKTFHCSEFGTCIGKIYYTQPCFYISVFSAFPIEIFSFTIRVVVRITPYSMTFCISVTYSTGTDHPICFTVHVTFSWKLTDLYPGPHAWMQCILWFC